MVEKIPVFVVHTGKSRCLDITLKAIKATGHRAIYIGDQAHLESVCESYIGDFGQERFEGFRSVYRHLSSNSEQFEIACFRRYFDIFTVAEKLGLSSFWMADSDLLLISNLEMATQQILRGGWRVSLSEQIQRSDAALKSSSPHLSLWTIGSLRDFIEFVDHTYRCEISALMHMYDKYQQECCGSGGVCDMTLLHLWAVNRVDVHNNARLINLELGVFDHNINVSKNYDDSYKMDGLVGIKHVVAVGSRYGCLAKLGPVPFVCFHFQGRAKLAMPAIAWVIKNNIRNPWLIRLATCFSVVVLMIDKSVKKLASIFRFSYA